jgi:hypothetical protein
VASAIAFQPAAIPPPIVISREASHVLTLDTVDARGHSACVGPLAQFMVHILVGLRCCSRHQKAWQKGPMTRGLPPPPRLPHFYGRE